MAKAKKKKKEKKIDPPFWEVLEGIGAFVYQGEPVPGLPKAKTGPTVELPQNYVAFLLVGGNEDKAEAIKRLAGKDAPLGRMMLAAKVLDTAKSWEDLEKYGKVFELPVGRIEGLTPEWSRSLLTFVQAVSERGWKDTYRNRLLELLKQAPLDRALDAVEKLREMDIEGLDDVLQEVLKEFTARLYHEFLLSEAFGIEKEDYIGPSRLYKTKSFRKAVGPGWYLVNPFTDPTVDIIDEIPGILLGKSKKQVSTPIVKVSQVFGQEDLLDMLGEIFILRSANGVSFILCPYSGDIYCVYPSGRVQLIPWSQYVQKGVTFVRDYLDLEDDIIYIAVRPKRVVLRKVLSPQQLAGLLLHFGFKPEVDALVKDGIAPDEETAAILARLMRTLEVEQEPNEGYKTPQDNIQEGVNTQ